MSWYKIKINLTAKLYSVYRRMLTRPEDSRAYGICTFKITRKCELRNGYWDWKYQMEVAHFYRRNIFSVTYNDMNVDPACRRCHKWMDTHKTEHEAFKLEQLGQRDFDKLLIASQILVRKSDQRIKETALREWLRGEIKKLEQ